jgi:hypothetical protein
MKLGRRLTKLGAQRQGEEMRPRVIIHDMVWRTDDGDLQSVAAFAKVLTATGWQTVTRADGEPELAFHARADAMAVQGVA